MLFRSLGIGECAGEVVSTTQFDLTDAEREVFEAQVKLEQEIGRASCRERV